MFLVTTLVVHRPRPHVVKLDHSPPTSSFPSGHTAAALTLYGALALLIYLHTRRRSAWLLLLMPAAVGMARLYRGMHHPSDVLAGLLLGTLAITAAYRAVLKPAADAPATARRPAVGGGLASSVRR
jgi:membrane-associated phospholipid phosphatase